MANILYISVMNQADGWAKQSQDIAKALIATGHNIVARPVYVANTVDRNLPQELEEIQTKTADYYDFVIQVNLPNYLSYNRDLGKNIGMSFFETRNITWTGWVDKINMMDAYWVSSEVEKRNLVESGVTIPIQVLGTVTDIEKFGRKYTKVKELDSPTFKFYFIGEYSRRKNLLAAVTAFHREFSPSEKVDFVIKANVSGIDQQHVYHYLDQELQNMKMGLNLYRNIKEYKKEICVTGPMSDEEIYNLHCSCDCFVMPSYGEAICRPAVDAMGFGNACIVTNHTGMTQFVNNKNGYLIDSVEVPLLSQSPVVFPDIYTARETWMEPSILHLQTLMRKAYNERNKKTKRKQAINDIFQCSYDNLAQRLNECLASLQNN